MFQAWDMYVQARLIPKELSFFQKVHWKQVAEDMLERANSYPIFMKCIVTDDLIWIYEYGIQTNHQPSEWRCQMNPSQENHANRSQKQRFR